MSHMGGSSRTAASVSHAADPLEDIAASTVAMIILFGSLTFATVSMMTRALLLGDRRAISAATSIKLKSPFPESAESEISIQLDSRAGRVVDSRGDTDVAETADTALPSNSNEHAVEHTRKPPRPNHPQFVGSSRSVAHARNTPGSTEGNTVMNIRLQETAFVQTFVLLYHMTLFGLVLFAIYLMDKYPLNGSPSSTRSQTGKVINEALQFNADQFVSWMIVLVAYSCFISWQRNDGKKREIKAQSKTKATNNQRDSSTEIYSLKDGEVPLRHPPRSNLKPGFRRDERSTVSRGSSQSGLSKRLEDIMLEEVLGHEDHDTIDDAFENAKHDNRGWLERCFSVLGLNLRATNDEGTVREWNPVDDVLNPLQALEWKGFLSAALLVYQYSSAGQSGTYMATADAVDQPNGALDLVSPAWRNMETIAVSCFLFLTGYSHTSYYYYHPDNIQKAPTEFTPHCYGLSRVLGILFRWNWTAIFLSLALGNNLVEYYVVCPVHSFFFMLIWSVLRVYYSINYNKYKFRLKMLAFACLMLLSDVTLTKLVGDDSMARMFWEWRSLTHLHYLAAFSGAVYAINQPISSLQLRRIESLSLITNIIAKGSMFLVLIGATISWAAGPLQHFSYNNTHTYFGIVPILTFLYVRNLSHGLRENHNRLFSWMGQYSLEIFLLSRHTLFHGKFAIFVPGYPNVNFVVVCVVILFTARALNNLTQILRQMLLPENEEQNSIILASAFTFGLLILYSFAKLLCWTDLLTLGSIFTITIILGVLLYQTIMDTTWLEYRSRSQGRPSSTEAAESNVTKVIVPISGVMSVFTISLVWYGWACYSGTIGALNMSCIDHVNRGFWLPIHACSVRSSLQESINYFGYEECEDFIVGKQWVWPNDDPINCGFRFRGINDIKSSLLQKRVTFIGDSSVRSLFYALCRSMGDYDAGQYEGVASHSDLRRLFTSANIEYKWSPLSVDIVTKLKSMRTTGLSSGKPMPDLLIAGGGAWDKLHMAATDEDQQSYVETVTKLAFELNYLREQGIPVVWFVPPVINTPALNSDEKRVQMSELSLEDTRRMYRELRVLSSATFVLDGPSFTKERVTDSFDGIDYPKDVYDAGKNHSFVSFHTS
eukprot:CCRYP_011503-RC/>CCRYP_011503-RC protein AED:0.06 eAED:0.06 QI:192/1/1/1/1/0.75/4/766/1109